MVLRRDLQWKNSTISGLTAAKSACYTPLSTWWNPQEKSSANLQNKIFKPKPHALVYQSLYFLSRGSKDGYAGEYADQQVNTSQCGVHVMAMQSQIDCSCTYHTHDIRQDSSRGTNEGTDDGQQVVVQQESFSAQSPSRITVQDCNDDRHVSTANGSCESDSLWQTQEKIH